ncbi:gliding motility-associated C-terminal domain-containing protein [Pedobacter punctiformis]|uniref:Gliding motility-associated C-terminal domain-containing protein n=1 Tax=Pedobacter punctiformis TaxID=3004097 RepID=A0ABT4L9Q6_9SPHI|nr:gliding motility-associated C-terminal domain-containing protein [Pedobacter sp. HCMS5-2]MCZ4244650.1 gliding motility-associated C-terminal domain-containing protein [Pedobacter sp. HCMS5-2]
MRQRLCSFLLLVFLLFFVKTGFSQNTHDELQTVSIRKGSSAVLHANSSGASSYLWFKDNVLIKGQNKDVLITATAGMYKVVAINNFGCTSDASANIKLLILPEIAADISITKRSETRTVLSNQVFDYYLNVRNNGVDDASQINVKDALPDNLIFEGLGEPTDGTAVYNGATKTINWNIAFLANQKFAELVIKVRSKLPGTVTNTATVTANEYDPNLSNNTSTDNKEISGLRIPNVFTPNGDGKNDSFYIENLNSFEANEVTVINRWGSTVFQSNGYLNDWTAPGLSDGTYFYVVKVRNGTSAWLEYKGYVTVIR